MWKISVGFLSAYSDENSMLGKYLSTWQKLARWSIASSALALACRPSISKKQKTKNK